MQSKGLKKDCKKVITKTRNNETEECDHMSLHNSSDELYLYLGVKINDFILLKFV